MVALYLVPLLLRYPENYTGELMAIVNNTIAIDLTQDWTNSTLTMMTIERPPLALALKKQTLWWDDTNGTIYCFGGEKSSLPPNNDIPTPQESIWGLRPDTNGTGNWIEYVGPTSEKPFPQNILRPAFGSSGDDGENGYFFGGYIDYKTSPSAADVARAQAAPGLLTFNFGSLTLTNDTNVAMRVQSSTWVTPGVMLHSPFYGSSGILLAIGGDVGPLEAGGPFNNISVFDLGSRKWYYQAATGTIPSQRSNFCAVAAQGKDNASFEMWVSTVLSMIPLEINIADYWQDSSMAAASMAAVHRIM